MTFCELIVDFMEEKKEKKNTMRRGTRGLDQPVLFANTQFIFQPISKN